MDEKIAWLYDIATIIIIIIIIILRSTFENTIGKYFS